MNIDIAMLAERLLVTMTEVPIGPAHRSRWVRGFVHGYLGLPYDVDGIRHSKHFEPIVPSSDPYRQGFLNGRAQRMPRN